MTPTQSPTLASQATAELPKLPDEVAIADGTFNSNAPLGSPLYTADQMNAHYLAGVEAGRASRAQSEWQSMDSAPKDGTTVYLHVSGHVYEGSWLDIPFSESRDADGHYLDQQDAEAYWMDHERGDTLEPTEWMPKNLPKPPATLGETK